MRINAATDFSPRSREIFSRGRPRAVEKISAASVLTYNPDHAEQADYEWGASPTPAVAYQNETNGAAPMRNTSHLSSAFVAQLLGQMMEERPAPSACHLAAIGAYRGTASNCAKLLDRRG